MDGSPACPESLAERPSSQPPPHGSLSREERDISLGSHSQLPVCLHMAAASCETLCPQPNAQTLSAALSSNPGLILSKAPLLCGWHSSGWPCPDRRLQNSPTGASLTRHFSPDAAAASDWWVGFILGGRAGGEVFPKALHSRPATPQLHQGGHYQLVASLPCEPDDPSLPSFPGTHRS